LVKGNHEEVVELIRRFREEVELMIPEIAEVPGTAREGVERVEG
jgi:hypothetical protein